MRLLILSFLFTFAGAVSAADTFTITPFSPSSQTETAADIRKLLSEQTTIKTIAPASAVTIPAPPQEGFASADYIKTITSLYKNTGADYIITGSTASENSSFIVAFYLISVSDARTVYSSSLSYPKDDKIYNPAADIAGRIIFFLGKKTFPLNKLTASPVEKTKSIKLTWEAFKDAEGYVMYRSKKKDGVYLFAGISNDPEFIDTKIDVAYRYFYKAAPIIGGIRTEPGDPVSEYIRPIVPKDKDLKVLIDSYNKPRPRLNGDALAKANAHIDVVKDIYFNRVKLNMILYISRSYIDNQELFVYNGFKKFIIDKGNRKITLESDKGDYEIFFDNNTFFTNVVNKGPDELSEILVSNAVFFCVPHSFKEKILENGETMYIPVMEVASMCTQYFRDCREWPTSTLVFGTANKELRGKMEEARRKKDSENNQ